MSETYDIYLKRENLLLRIAAVCREAGASPAAVMDLATRIADDHRAEVRPDGRIALGSGARLADALDDLRRDVPSYWTHPEPVAVQAPETASVPTTAAALRRRASDRLEKANAGRPASLNEVD